MHFLQFLFLLSPVKFWRLFSSLELDYSSGDIRVAVDDCWLVAVQDGDLVLGAPGPYNWRGAIFRNSINQSLTGEGTSWLQSPVEDVLPTQDDKPEPATRYYSYLGACRLVLSIVCVRSAAAVGGDDSLYFWLFHGVKFCRNIVGRCCEVTVWRSSM